jgi:hypothetical protein
MKDYGTLFERIVENHFGSPKTSVYFASFYGDNFATSALLFSIVTKAINYNYENYSSNDIDTLKTYEYKGMTQQLKYADNIDMIEFLSKLMAK